jgi:hypothetical protein
VAHAGIVVHSQTQTEGNITMTTNTETVIYTASQSKAMANFAEASALAGKVRGKLWAATSALAREFPDVVAGKAAAYRAAIAASLENVEDAGGKNAGRQMGSSVASAMERGHTPPEKGETIDAYRERTKKEDGGRGTKERNKDTAENTPKPATDALAGEAVDVESAAAPFLRRIAKALSTGGLPLAQYLASEAESWLKAQSVASPKPAEKEAA